MSTVGVLIIALALIVFVFFWSSRHGDRNRRRGTSLRRGSNSHTTLRGGAKVGYAKREEAEAHAQSMTRRDGAPMSVYQCGTCAKWHVGHVK